MIKNKKQQHFLKLYEPIHDPFERFCRARVFGNMEYQDLMNDTLLVAFEKLDQLKSEQAFLSFLIGISVRLLANHHKKKKEDSMARPEKLELHDVNANTERDAEIYLLHKALAMLSDEQRECLILFEISGFSMKEIVEIQGVSLSAVKQRLKRGRARLTEILTFESNDQSKEVKNGTC